MGVPDPRALAAELRVNPYLREPVAELRVGVGEAMQMVAAEVLNATGEAHASDLLAQWAGFAPFCRDNLGVKPLVLTERSG